MATRNINKELHERVLDLSLQLLDVLKEFNINDRLCLSISPNSDYVNFFILTGTDENGDSEYILDHSQWSEEDRIVIYAED